MGHHGIWGKGNGTFPLNMYDTSVKVPAISRTRRVPAGRRWTTICSATTTSCPRCWTTWACANPQAQTLPGPQLRAAAARRDACAGREHVVVFDEYGPVRMIRTPRVEVRPPLPGRPARVLRPGQRPGRTAQPDRRPGASGAHRRDEGPVGRVVPALRRSGGGWGGEPVTGKGQRGGPGWRPGREGLCG